MSSGLQFRLSGQSVMDPTWSGTGTGNGDWDHWGQPRTLGPSLPWDLSRDGRSYVSRTEELKRRLGAAAASEQQYGSFRNLTK